MAKLPWYLKADGKPEYKSGKLMQSIKIHWLYVAYIWIKSEFTKR